MKIRLLILCALCATRLSYAQDSLQVTFSEERDTLAKQHFVDRFENIFMTKVPSRNMVKLDISQSELTGIGLYAGYEFKILPALSFEAGVYGQTSTNNRPLWDEISSFRFSKMSIWTRARARYYFNMDRRMRAGLGTNNFNGAYVGLNYDQSLFLNEWYGYRNKNIGRVGLLLGYQGRLLNHGHFDFNVGIFNKESSYDKHFYPIEGFLKPKNFVLSTQTNIGIAFGDWKRKARAPLCDVLVCNEQISGQFKIQLPDILLGLQNQRVNIGATYEHKLGSSPLSVSGSLAANYYHTKAWEIASGGVSGGVSLRAYFLQNLLLRKGWGGSSLSGPYAGLNAAYSYFFFQQSGNPMLGQPEGLVSSEYLYSGQSSLTIGYQQRIFGRFYIDASVGYGYSFYLKSNVDYYQYTKRFGSVSSDIKIGFTF